MSVDADRTSARSHLDLATIRETIAYIRDDISGVEGLEAATSALSMALMSIEHKERGAPPRGFLRARFKAIRSRD